MTYLLDTNIIIYLVRNKSILEDSLAKVGVIDLFSSQNQLVISIVTVGELQSLALNNSWGHKKMQLLESLLTSFIIADINTEGVIKLYAEIDAFSQCKYNKQNATFTTPRNMGKNDLWIAATAAFLGTTLVTTDNDFNHLKDEYLSVISVDALKHLDNINTITKLAESDREDA